MIPRRRPLRVRAVLPLLALASLLTACGAPTGSTPPPDVRTVEGSVALPAGHGLDLDAMVVTTAVGTYPVDEAGAFVADVLAGTNAEVGLETAAGELVLLGAANGAAVELSLATTAEALLYYLVGGMWLPTEQQDRVRDLLRGQAAAEPIADELRRQLLAGGNGLAAPDAALVAALEDVHAALFADPALTGFAVAAGSRARGAMSLGVAPAEVDGTNIVIEPGGATQSGVQLLQNPTGAGVVAQNGFRRPAALLAYEVAWENADGVETPVDPPVLVAQVDVPATGQLEAFEAIFDVLTGDAPWAPVLSPAVPLAGRAEASRTHYELVLLGPTTSTAVPPILSDARFEGFHDAWDDIVLEKSLELFLDELLLPLVEVYGVGSLAKYDAAKLTQFRTRVRVLADEHLLGLGVYLRAGRTGYADALRFAITRLVERREFRLELMDTVMEALVESDRNRAAVEAMERRLSTRASASAIAAAVQTVLVGGDVAKIMADLGDSNAADAWTAISARALFALAPAQAIVSRDSPSATFTVVPKGTVSGTYRYRWTTSGEHGTISDLLQDGTSIDTDSNEIWYFHDWPTDIQDDDVDAIAVEVFEVEPGATSIPAGAQPVARMAASVRGDERLIDARIKLHYGTMHPDVYGEPYGCTVMVLRFDAVPGAEAYTLRIRGVGGQGDLRNPNQAFRNEGPNHDVLVDPDASSGNAGYVGSYVDHCRWMRDGVYTLPPHTLGTRYDAEARQFVVHLFVNVQHGFGTPSSVALPLWYDWVDGATFELVVHD